MNRSKEPVEYDVKLTDDDGRVLRLRARFRQTGHDILARGPIELFGPVFKASLEEGAAAFFDPRVLKVPVYRADDLEPVAYLTRAV